MKIPLLGCVAIAYAASAFAAQTGTNQTSSAQSTTSANQTVTLSGCVGGGASATDPFTLSNVSIVNAAPSASATSPTGTTGAAGTVGATGTTGAATTGTATPPVGASATGTTATGLPITGMPPSAGATAGATPGYRLTGADVRPFLGQRVQIVGTFAPMPSVGGATGTTGSATASPTGAAGSWTNAVPEFRVVSIRPIGACQ